MNCPQGFSKVVKCSNYIFYLATASGVYDITPPGTGNEASLEFSVDFQQVVLGEERWWYPQWSACVCGGGGGAAGIGTAWRGVSRFIYMYCCGSRGISMKSEI